MAETGKKKRIMVVDDDEDVTDVLAWTLVEEGYDVTTAHDGEGVVDKLRSEEYVLLIVDLCMPRKGGLDVIREVRAGNLPVKICVITGYLDSESLSAIKTLKADMAFSKPFSPSDLLRRLKELEASSPD